MIYLVSNNPELFKSPDYSIISLQEAYDLIKEWDVIQFDTETGGRNCHLVPLLCAQFGNRAANTQIVVDCNGNNNILTFKTLLETKLIIGQNLKFDLQFLYNYKIVPTNIYDTMIAEQVLYLGYPPAGKSGGISYSLKAIAERYLGIDIDKSTRGEIIWRGLDTKVILYAAGDVQYLEDIKDCQEKEILKKDCLKAVQLENKFVPVIAYLEWCGIKLDQSKWQAKMNSDREHLEHATKSLNEFIERKADTDGYTLEQEFVLMKHLQGFPSEFYELPADAKEIPNSRREIQGELSQDNFPAIPYKSIVTKIKRKYPFCQVDLQGDLFSGFNTGPKCIVNWSSSQQVIQVAKYLGFNTSVQDKKTGEDKDSVLEKELSTQKGICDEFLKLYFSYQEYSKLVSSFGQGHLNAINPKTGRVHTVYKQLGAASGKINHYKCSYLVLISRFFL